MLRDFAIFGFKTVLSQMVNRCVHHYHSHPAHQQHLNIHIRFAFKLMQVPEYLDEPIVDNIYRLIVMIDVPENSFQAITIEVLIEKLLISLVITNTTKNDLL